MTIKIAGEKLVVKSHAPILAWLLIGVLAVAFLISILAMWSQNIGSIWVRVIFSIASCLVIWLLVRTLRDERIASSVFDARTKRIQLAAASPFRREVRSYPFKDMVRIEFRTSDNDGYFHRVFLIFGDGFELPITQGNHRVGVLEEQHRLVEYLSNSGHSIPLVEVEDA